MLELLLTAGSGGIFGIFGALFKHGLEVYQEGQKEKQSLLLLKEANTHELAMADKQAALMKLEAANAIKLADITATSQIEQSAYSALAASYDADKATYSESKQSKWMVFVDFIRGITRPHLTWLFSYSIIALTVLIFFKIEAHIINDIVLLKDTFKELVKSIIFLGTSSAGWYFAARPSTKQKD